MKNQRIKLKSKNITFTFYGLKVVIELNLIEHEHNIFSFYRLQKEAHKVPLPAKMYTKPVDVSSPHQFAAAKKLS